MCHENKSQLYINNFMQVSDFEFLLIDLYNSISLKNVIEAKRSLPRYENLLWLCP